MLWRLELQKDLYLDMTAMGIYVAGRTSLLKGHPFLDRIWQVKSKYIKEFKWSKCLRFGHCRCDTWSIGIKLRSVGPLAHVHLKMPWDLNPSPNDHTSCHTCMARGAILGLEIKSRSHSFYLLVQGELTIMFPGSLCTSKLKAECL